MAHEFTLEQRDALENFGQIFFGKLGKSALSLTSLTIILMPQGMVDEIDLKYAEELIAEIEEFLRIRELLSQPIDTLELSDRARHYMRAGNIKSIGDLVCREDGNMLKFRGFGRKDLVELTRVLEERGLHFGMDIDKYLKD